MKNIVITGGSRGIGSKTALLFAKNGYNVHIVFKENIKAATYTATKLYETYLSYIEITLCKIISSKVMDWSVDNSEIIRMRNALESVTKNLQNKNTLNPVIIKDSLHNQNYFQFDFKDREFTSLGQFLTGFQKLSTQNCGQHIDLSLPKFSLSKGNLTDRTFVDYFVEKVATYGDKIDVLVNSAGISTYEQVQDICRADFQDIFENNLYSCINMCRGVSTYMIREKAGRIINLSSMWADYGSSCESLYSASKGAIISFTKSLARELAPSNIYVNAVAPGVVDTDMVANFDQEEKNNLIEASLSKKISTPMDIAKTILFLSEDQGNYVGEVLYPRCGF